MTEESPFNPASALPRSGGGVCGDNGPPLLDLAAYVDGGIDPTVRAAVDSHLAVCAVCLDAVNDLRERAEAGSDALPFAPAHVIAAAAGLVPAGGAVAGHTSSASSWKLTRFSRQAGSVAAAIAVCLAGYAVGLATGSSTSDDGFDPAASFGLVDSLDAAELDDDDLLALAIAESSS